MEPGNINRLLLIEKVLVLKSLNLFKDTPENILAGPCSLNERNAI